MSEPIFGITTEQMYKRLPEQYRTEDIKTGWDLKRWVSGAGDQQSDVDAMVDRFSYVTPDDGGLLTDTSDLTDPMTADAAWLPWLAQLVGVVLDTTKPVADQRLQIRDVDFFKGTKNYMAAAARTVLTGDKSVTIYDHTISSAAIGAAGEWDVLVITIASETTTSPTDTIIKLGAKPAGIKLYHETFTSTWDELEAAKPTWDAWEAPPGTWTEIEEAGL